MRALRSCLFALAVLLVACTGPHEPTAEPLVAALATAHSGNLEATYLGQARASRGDRWYMFSYGTTVHDEAEQPVAGARVTFAITLGDVLRRVSCTSTATGECGVASSFRIHGNIREALFTVDTIVADGRAYDRLANHDTDGDSDGTTLVLAVP